LKGEEVIEVLRLMGGKASIPEIIQYAERLGKGRWDKTKLWDRLVLLSRHGFCERQGEIWLLTKKKEDC